MKKITLLFLFILSVVAYGQHTFSIVAVDPDTGEIGSAGATCIAAEDGAQLISDIVLGIGAIHTQSFYIPANQDNARGRMQFGDSPQEIMDWLVANDVQNNPTQRQYIAVDLNNGAPRSAGYTGENCFEEFLHVTGPGYAIAGNILISEDVITDMETAFLETDGTLAEKLMASLQGAKRPGADSRCLSDGISSSSAFIRVADPSDTDSSYGNLSLDLNVWITNEVFEPIDELQDLFDEALSTEEPAFKTAFNVYPNPTSGMLQVKSILGQVNAIEVMDITGRIIHTEAVLANITRLDLNRLNDGIYFILAKNGIKTVASQKVVLRK